MKDKIITFIKNKKELIVFALVIITIFSSVIAIANYALKDNSVTVNTPNDEIEDPIIDEIKDPIIENVSYKVSLPINSDYEIVRTFYDVSYDTDVLVNAFIMTDTTLTESKGVSFRSISNESVEVMNILPGTVIDIIDSDIYGYVVTIEHENGVISRYKSLSSINVIIGDILDENQCIGYTGESLYDIDALCHVHVEVIENSNYIDVTSIIGLSIDEFNNNK